MDFLTSPVVYQMAGLAVTGLVLLHSLVAVLDQLRRSRVQRVQEEEDRERFRNQIELERVRLGLMAKNVSRIGVLDEWYRKFKVKRKVVENRSGDIASFYLVPHDGRPLPTFNPGQFLTFKLAVPGKNRPVIRCYSLSDGPRDDYYRVSIKALPAPRNKPEVAPGVSSNFFHQHINEGDILDVKAPGGKFWLDMDQSWPVIAIGGGVGCTPGMSMVEAVCANAPQRKIAFFYGVRSGEEIAYGERLTKLAGEHENLTVYFFYSRPDGTDKALIEKTAQAEVSGASSRVLHVEGRVSIDRICEIIPGADETHHFYTCGPSPMMQSVAEGLEARGVPSERCHAEAFGPASIKKAKPAGAPTGGAGAKVQFAKGSKDLT